jgi:hypothetical protein
MRYRFRSVALVTAAILTTGSGCRRGNDDARAEDTLPDVESARTRSGSAVRTADRPRTGCDWLPVAEVEAILGPLAGPPSGHELSCRYRLPLDSATARSRADYRRVVGPDGSAVKDVDLDTVAVIVGIDLDGDVTSERAERIAGDMLGSMFASALGKNAAIDTLRPREEPPPPDGWDVATSPIRNRDFTGRIGHITVRVDENVIMEQAIPAAKKAALAALVRDRIPDLPFRVRRLDDAQPVEPPIGPDPCSLLTRSEAESVLGKLVVAPYRSHDGGPLAYERGSSCAYYTAGHRVLVVIPHWTDGKQDLTLVRGVGKLVGAVAADLEGAAADTLDGPWDDVALGLDGNLAFLKGDQLLEIAFATSSTDQAGALKLARIALERLATSSPTRP